MYSLADDLALLVAAAREAGAVALRHFEAGVEVIGKADGSPVSVADLEANAMLRDRFAQARPGYGWLSEESEDDAARLTCRHTVVVDPIDGTNAFIRGIPQWAVSVGLVEGHEAIAGVIYNAASGELFAASRGGGATLNGAPIACTRQGSVAGASIIAGTSLLRRPEFAGQLLSAHARWVHSVAYRMARVAAGFADATISLTPKREWDVCAAAVILAEAGGLATDLAGQPFRFNQPDTRSIGPIAAGLALHPRLVEIIAPTALAVSGVAHG